MTWILVQAMWRRGGVVSTITKVDRYNVTVTEPSQAINLARKSVDKWKRRFGDAWLVIAAEVDEEEASEVLADLKIG